MSLVDNLKLCGSKTRVQGTTSLTTIKNAPGALLHIIVRNANAGAQTLQVNDDTTVLGVYEVPANDTRSLTFNCKIDANLKVTPSSNDIDALVVFV